PHPPVPSFPTRRSSDLSGSATARRSRARSASVVMELALVFGDAVGGDVPAAAVAGGGFFVARVAVERAAVEELLQPVAVVRGQLDRKSTRLNSSHSQIS